MNVGKTSASSLHMGKSHPNCTLLKIYFAQKGWILVQRIANLSVCYSYLLPDRLCMGKVHLKLILHKRGLGLKKDFIMNMRDMCHE